MNKEEVAIGKVVSPHGVRGLFSVLIYSRNEKEFFLYKNCYHIKKIRIDIHKKFNKGKFLICESPSIENRNQVSDILNEEIFVFEKDLQIDNNIEYFHKDLIGCEVINFQSEKIGNVIAIHNFGAGDILELDGKFPYMIRFSDIKKKNINLKKKTIFTKLEF